MELCGVNIPDKVFTAPIYILSRTTSLTAAFNPKDRVVPQHMAYRQYVGDACDQRALINDISNCRMLAFSIQRLHAKEPPIRIRLPFWFLHNLHQVIHSTKNGTWVKKAAYTYFLTHPDLADAPADEEDPTINIQNSIEPLLLMEAGGPNWPDSTVGAVTMGTDLSIYYQPKSPKGEKIKKPWTWKFTHYQLEFHEDKTVTRINERTLSIQMSTEDIERIVTTLGKNIFLWDGFQTTEQLFGPSSEVSR